MKIQIDTLIDDKSVKIVNASLTYVNRYDNFEDVLMSLRNKINNLGLHTSYDCGRGADHIWVSRLVDGERIILITN